MRARLRCPNRTPEGFGDLGERQPFDVAKDDRGPIVRRQLVERRGQDVSQLPLHRRIGELRRRVGDGIGMMAILAEAGKNFVERDFVAPMCAAAALLVSGVRRDSVDPRS